MFEEGLKKAGVENKRGSRIYEGFFGRRSRKGGLKVEGVNFGAEFQSGAVKL